MSGPPFIVGTGRYLPADVVTNAALAARLGVTNDWIVSNTGIRARHWAEATQATSDLAVAAAEQALKTAALGTGDIDYLIAGTMSPDHQVPGIGPLVQSKLRLGQIPSLDIRATCCNPLFGFDLALALLAANRARNVLVVGAEVQSKGLDLSPDARDISTLFGDGAGACIMSRDARPGALSILDVSLFTDGRFARDLAVLAPGTANGARWYDGDPESSRLVYPVMNGKSVILHAARKLAEAARFTLDRHGWAPGTIDLVIPHQANANLLMAVARQLGIPEDRIVSVLEWSGNTSSASTLIALDWAYEQGLLISGARVLFVGFGAGFTWGAATGIVE